MASWAVRAGARALCAYSSQISLSPALAVARTAAAIISRDSSSYSSTPNEKTCARGALTAQQGADRVTRVQRSLGAGVPGTVMHKDGTQERERAAYQRMFS